MSDRQIDALIVGAGPAGLAAAIVLARSGLSVMVCERGMLPRDKACGEGVMPTGVDYLTDLGAAEYLEAHSASRLAGIRFHSMAGDVATARFAEGHGLGIRRTNLSAALLGAARNFPAVEIRQMSAARRLHVTAHGIRVDLGGGAVTARLLIGADGLYSHVRRWAGLEDAPRRRRRLGARQHFAIDMPEPFVDVVQGEGIEAYLTPCGERQTGIAFLWDTAVYRRAQKGTRLIASLMAAFPELERRFAGAMPLSAPLCSGPLHRAARSQTADGVLLIGDAGGYIDACTGEGISIALAQALALEATVVPLLKRHRGLLMRADLAPYVEACRSITRPYKIGTAIQLYLCRHTHVANRLVRAMANEPALLAHFISANMGRAPFWPGWRAGSRLLRAVLRA